MTRQIDAEFPDNPRGRALTISGTRSGIRLADGDTVLIQNVDVYLLVQALLDEAQGSKAQRWRTAIMRS